MSNEESNSQDQKDTGNTQQILNQLTRMEASFMKIVEILPGLEKMYTNIADLADAIASSNFHPKTTQLIEKFDKLSQTVMGVLERNEHQQQILNIIVQQQEEKTAHHQQQMNQMHRQYAEQHQQTINLLGQILLESIQRKQTNIQRHELDETLLRTLGQLLETFQNSHDIPPPATPISVEPPEQSDQFNLGYFVLGALETLIQNDTEPAELWRKLPLFLQNILMKLNRKDISNVLEAIFDSKILNSSQGQQWFHTFCMFLEALQHNAATPDHPFEEEE